MVAVTLKTRMPVNKLRKKDLDAFPIWEYADDKQGDVLHGRSLRDLGRGKRPLEEWWHEVSTSQILGQTKGQLYGKRKCTSSSRLARTRFK